MELHLVATRAFFVYVILLALLRVSGKRTVAQATPFDFVLTLILGDLIDDALWAEVSFPRFIVAVVTLAAVHLFLAWAASRSEWVERLIDGAATEVMREGKPLPAGQRRERVSDRELTYEVREAGVDREKWGDVQVAHVECSGAVSVLLQEWARPMQRRDATAARKLRPSR